MKTLDEICLHHGTDKATRHPVVIPAHAYAPVYDSHFAKQRNDEIKFLEIGVGGGESIRSWLEYFPNAKIFGVDITHDTNPWNTPGSSPDPRYTFCQGDQSSEVFWQCFAATYGSGWDIIIDDGGHCSNQVVTTYKMMWPHVISGGRYCIEDLGVAYGNSPFFCPDGWPNHMKFLADRMDEINRSGDIDSFNLTKELAILVKK